MLKNILEWFVDTGVAIVIIIIIAMILQYIGRKIIHIFIKRSIHGRHLGRPKQPLADVVKRQNTIISLSTVIWKVIVILGAGLAIFREFFPSFDFVPLLASAGVLGAIIGFGAQSVIRDIIAGLFIIAENQFRVGDTIDIEGIGVSGSGKVEHITLRSTVVRDEEGNVHYIPNGSILHITNKTMGYSKVNFSIPVRIDSNIDTAAVIINQVGEKLAKREEWQRRVIEAPHFIRVGEFKDSFVELRISGKTAPGDQWAVASQLKRDLLVELRKHKDIILSQDELQPVKESTKSKK